MKLDGRSAGADGAGADFEDGAACDEVWWEPGAAGGGEPDLVEAVEAGEDGSAASVVHLGENVVQEQDGWVLRGSPQQGGLGES